MVDKIKIWELLDKYFRLTGDIVVDDDGTISGARIVSIIRSVSRLPVEFGTVSGWFDGSDIGLTSLKGSPKTVGKFFNCCGNKLTSLEGGPGTVGLNFDCTGNPLKSLKGAPTKIGGSFHLDYHPDLPLLRTLVAEEGVRFGVNSMLKYPYSEKIEDVLLKFGGHGKKSVLQCTKELLTLEKELGIDIRANIKW